MRRRDFCLTAAALCAAPAVTHAYSAQTFSPNLWRTLRQDQNVVILNYRATWSMTCQIKADILADLLAANPDYQQLSFVEVDWDTFGRSVMTERLKVRRRSTLLVMRGGEEVARLVNEPFEPQIRALLDKALAA